MDLPMEHGTRSLRAWWEYKTPAGSRWARRWQYSAPFRRRFGLLRGVRAADAVANAEWRAQTREPVAVAVPGWRDPIWLRPQTTDVGIYRQLVLGDELGFAMQTVPRRIVDGGANIGLASRVFAERWPGVEILAVELESGNVDLLRRNCAVLPRVQVVHGAVWDIDSRVNFASNDYGECGFQAIDSDNGSIQSFTVASLLDRAGWQQVDLLKLDIEGAEERVLRTADAWLPRVQNVAIELHDRLVPGCSDAFRSALAGRGFRVRAHGEYAVAERVSTWRRN